MSTTDPKRSALQTARLRAAHQLFDRPLIFEDPLALAILGTDEANALRGEQEHHAKPLMRGLRTSVALRSRMAEDSWEEFRQAGVRQYVLLGAGLDTFAYRRAQDPELCVYEVDLPSTQAWKRECLAAADIAEPACAVYVPVDFERTSLANELERTGFERDRPALVSWLGVNMYLEPEAGQAVFDFAAGLAPGSGLLFDYAVAEKCLTPAEASIMRLISSVTASNGEPWKTFHVPAVLRLTLLAAGFAHVDDYGPAELTFRYLRDRADGRTKSGVSRIILARL